MKDAEARIIIFCNVEGPQQTLIEGCASSAEMWERLMLQYANAAPINGNILLEKFFNYKYNPGILTLQFIKLKNLVNSHMITVHRAQSAGSCGSLHKLGRRAEKLGITCH
jgi:hypothetical protein